VQRRTVTVAGGERIGIAGRHPGRVSVRIGLSFRCALRESEFTCGARLGAARRPAVGGDVIVVGNTQTRIAGTESYTWQPMTWYGSGLP
jgi:hypothetical protein